MDRKNALGKSLMYSYLPRGNPISGVDLGGHGFMAMMEAFNALNKLKYLLI